jgi:hypothetical protein
LEKIFHVTLEDQKPAAGRKRENYEKRSPELREGLLSEVILPVNPFFRKVASGVCQECMISTEQKPVTTTKQVAIPHHFVVILTPDHRPRLERISMPLL